MEIQHLDFYDDDFVPTYIRDGANRMLRDFYNDEPMTVRQKLFAAYHRGHVEAVARYGRVAVTSFFAGAVFGTLIVNVLWKLLP